MLLDGGGAVRAVFHGSVIGHHHALLAVYHADARHQAARRHRIIVKLVTGQGSDFQQRRAFVTKRRDPLAIHIASKTAPKERGGAWTMVSSGEIVGDPSTLLPIERQEPEGNVLRPPKDAEVTFVESQKLRHSVAVG